MIIFMKELVTDHSPWTEMQMICLKQRKNMNNNNTNHMVMVKKVTPCPKPLPLLQNKTIYKVL